MNKLYKAGFFILLGVFLFMSLTAQVGRWPWLQCRGVAFQYTQRITSVNEDSLTMTSPNSFILYLDSIAISAITSDITIDKITVEDSIVADEIFVQGIFHLASGYMSGDSAFLSDGSIVGTPAAGMILMDTSIDTMMSYDGSAWNHLY